MSNTRIKDLTTTALTAASDDYLAIDGATNGTRKIKPSDIGGSSITVDSSMSSTSENPVQNKVIYTALQDKVDTVSGKGLSTNDFTDAEKTKLSGIATGAEVNVQSDWSQSDNTADDYIKNKPSLATVATSGAYSDLSGTPTLATVATSGLYSDLSGTPTIPSVTSLTVSLVVADWSSSTQTVTATGVTANSSVVVSPDPTSLDDYVAAGIVCTAQAANSLTFTCDTTPTSAITVNVLSIA